MITRIADKIAGGHNLGALTAEEMGFVATSDAATMDGLLDAIGARLDEASSRVARPRRCWEVDGGTENLIATTRISPPVYGEPIPQHDRASRPVS